MFLIHYANVARLSPRRLRNNQFRLNARGKQGVYIEDKRAQRRFPRAERFHVVADEVDYARCDKTRKRIKRGKIEEPWPGARGGGGGSVLRSRSNQHSLSCPIMQRHEHTLENVLRLLSTMFNAGILKCDRWFFTAWFLSLLIQSKAFLILTNQLREELIKI